MNEETALEHLDFRAFYKAAVPSLRINGKAEAIGLCPFHNDQAHPNFQVNLDSGLWKCCAGCGGGTSKEPLWSTLQS